MRAVESLVLAVTILILEESVIEPLPDAADTSVSEEDELELAAAEEELLSSLFAQPRRIRLIATSIIASKLVALFIVTPYRMNEF